MAHQPPVRAPPPLGPGATIPGLTPAPSPFALLDMFIPGFSIVVSSVHRYFGIDLTLYLPLFVMYTGLAWLWRYLSVFLWETAESYLLSVCDLRPDDELYFQVLAWVAAQRFSQNSRRFVANSSLNGRRWWYYDDDDSDDDADFSNCDSLDGAMVNSEQKKPLSFTPSFGSHNFWFKGRLLRFTRVKNREQNGFLRVSEKEEISISCFGRDPWILKQLLNEARLQHLKKDERKTFIYRGTCRSGDVRIDQGKRSYSTKISTTILVNPHYSLSLILLG